MLERAIRASVQEMERLPDEEDDEQVVQRAIRASMREASHFGPEDETDSDEELKKALELSKSVEHLPEDDEHLQKALELSKSTEHLGGKDGAHEGDEELRKAIEESEKEGKEMERQRTEEEIVMEYVKRQSILEEEHRRAMLQGRETSMTKEGESSQGS